MIDDGQLLKAADYCMRRDYRATRPQVLATIEGLRSSGHGWTTRHGTRIANLVRRGVEIEVLSPTKDKELYTELSASGLQVQALSQTT